MNTNIAPQGEILDHYALVRRVARKIHGRLPSHVQLDDLISVGVIGLIEAIERYDASRGVPFETFARHRIRGSILDSLRAADWVPHSVRRKAVAIERARRSVQQRRGEQPDEATVAAAMGLPVDRYRNMARDAEIRSVLSLDAPAANDNPTPLSEIVPGDADLAEECEQAELRGLVHAAIQTLPERERQAITMYYLQGLQLKQVGAALGVSESRACQLCGQGIKRLRRSLRHLA